MLAAGAVLAGRAAFGPVVRPVPVPPPSPAVRADAADAFLAAWRRSLTTSWAVEEEFVRTAAGGRRLSFVIDEAQRPPDRLRSGFGTVDGVLGGRQLACATAAGGDTACRTTPAAPLGRRVDTELATLRPYVAGPRPLYDVARVAGCFELRLRIARFPVPPYGRRAVFCFDPDTGAPAGSVVERDAGVDTTRVVGAHAPATPADLRLPAGVTLG